MLVYHGEIFFPYKAKIKLSKPSIINEGPFLDSGSTCKNLSSNHVSPFHHQICFTQ